MAKYLDLDGLQRYDQHIKDHIQVEIADAISNVYNYKGTKTVAQINGLSNMSTGDVYNVSDSGTVTPGNVSVVAGDNVAWNGSAWTKLGATLDLSGYQTKIDSENPLSADLVDDTSTTNKFVIAYDKTWLEKAEGGIKPINISIPGLSTTILELYNAVSGTYSGAVIDADGVLAFVYINKGGGIYQVRILQNDKQYYGTPTETAVENNGATISSLTQVTLHDRAGLVDATGLTGSSTIGELRTLMNNETTALVKFGSITFADSSTYNLGVCLVSLIVAGSTVTHFEIISPAGYTFYLGTIGTSATLSNCSKSFLNNVSITNTEIDNLFS